jgi:hypothetical protein
MSHQCKSHDSSVSHRLNCVQSLDSSALLLPTPLWQQLPCHPSALCLSLCMVCRACPRPQSISSRRQITSTNKTLSTCHNIPSDRMLGRALGKSALGNHDSILQLPMMVLSGGLDGQMMWIQLERHSPRIPNGNPR